MKNRFGNFIIFVFFASAVIFSRLFFWQIISRNKLQAAAIAQRTSAQVVNPDRGKILANDDFALVTNRPDYVMYAYKPQLNNSPEEISTVLAPIVLDPNPRDATEAAKPIDQRQFEAKSYLYDQLSGETPKWVPLWRHLNQSSKETIEAIDIDGIGFDEYSVRHYPESSMSAHLLGFVGRNQDGEPTGYFGLEGYYDLELRGKKGLIQTETDATGNPILIGLFKKTPQRKGRTLKTHINRQIQHASDTALIEGINKYQAKSGEIIIMDPNNGAILAMSAFPNYDPAFFNEFDPQYYKNPSIANFYEPGSTFKTIIMAAAVEEGLISPTTTCDSTCDGPVKIGNYTIRTWNDQYFPGQNMEEVLSRSDNTGMIFVANKLGVDSMVNYLNNFGFGQLTRIDLQEEASPKLRSKWGDIDLATTSFGQGIAVTGIQMISAISAIANGGTLYQPQVVDQVLDDKAVNIEPKPVRQVISEHTAQTITQMMIASAHHGEAQWAVLKKYQIAGKTGTAQIPIAGHYDADKTIASFIGFAPAHDPKFAMLVKLQETESSPWAAETAAPLWFNLAHDLLVMLNVPPQE